MRISPEQSGKQSPLGVPIPEGESFRGEVQREGPLEVPVPGEIRGVQPQGGGGGWVGSASPGKVGEKVSLVSVPWGCGREVLPEGCGSIAAVSV